MRVRSQQDFAAGLAFCGIGAAFAITSLNYPMGTAGRMGPGYFPFGLGILLAILGAFIILRSFAINIPEDKLTRWNIKGLVLILGSVVLFGFLLLRFGVIVAVAVSVIVSAIADRGFKLPGTVVAALVLMIICVVGFVYGLGLQMPVVPPFLGR